MPAINWTKAFQPLIKKYKNKPHPLEFKNPYQLVVMVVMAATDSDRNINKVAPELFRVFPDFKSLAGTNYDTLSPFLLHVRSGKKKTNYLIELAKAIKTEKKIPTTIKELEKLPGVGRKSASVIIRELGAQAEGIIVDLHVLRVAPRLGIATGTDAKKVEKQLMEAVDKEMWGELGMAISHLGREICRPTDPKHDKCVMNKVCQYYKTLHS